jgi:hypothetical protein
MLRTSESSLQMFVVGNGFTGVLVEGSAYLSALISAGLTLNCAGQWFHLKSFHVTAESISILWGGLHGISRAGPE